MRDSETHERIPVRSMRFLVAAPLLLLPIAAQTTYVLRSSRHIELHVRWDSAWHVTAAALKCTRGRQVTWYPIDPACIHLAKADERGALPVQSEIH